MISISPQAGQLTSSKLAPSNQKAGQILESKVKGPGFEGGARAGGAMGFMAIISEVTGLSIEELREEAAAGATMEEIIAAHGIPYVATASIAYLGDLKKKVKKAMTYHGARYIQIDTPCPSVWSFASHLTLEIGRLGVNSGLVPLFEKEKGEITAIRKIKRKIPVADYLNKQKRYRHLFDSKQGQLEIEKIQALADTNIEKYGLLSV